METHVPIIPWINQLPAFFAQKHAKNAGKTRYLGINQLPAFFAQKHAKNAGKTHYLGINQLPAYSAKKIAEYAGKTPLLRELSAVKTYFMSNEPAGRPPSHSFSYSKIDRSLMTQRSSPCIVHAAREDRTAQQRTQQQKMNRSTAAAPAPLSSVSFLPSSTSK